MSESVLELVDDRSRLVIAAAKGGGIASFDALVPGRAPVPLLKPARADAVGCELLVPWSNRISGGGFDFDGRFHPVEPNVPGEPFPLHGDGFQKPWRVARQTAAEAELVLDDGSIGPYRYAARVVYALREGALDATLTVENRASIRLPYGLGFHPWFPRHAGTSLTATASRVWLEDERHLPTGVEPVAAHPAWDFSQGAPLPAGWINNGFDGWDRRADDRPARRRGCAVARGVARARRVHRVFAGGRCRLLLLRAGVASGRCASWRRPDGAGAWRQA